MKLATRKLREFENTVFLTGSGSVQLSKNGQEYYKTNGNCSTWWPFLSAIKKWDEYEREIARPSRNWLPQIEAERLAIAIKCNTAKSCLDYLIRKTVAGTLISSDELELANVVSVLRNKISTEFQYCHDNNLIEIRINTFHSLQNIVSHFRSQFKHATVTTNWDKSWLFDHNGEIRQDHQNVPYYHIHGSFDLEDEIYLPMDYVFEDALRHQTLIDAIARFEESRQLSLKNQANLLLKALRKSETIDSMSKKQADLIEVLNNADLLVIWGLSFAAEDFELRSIVSAVAEDFLQKRCWPKTIIIDIYEETRNKIAQILSLPPAYRFDMDPKCPDYLEIFDMRNL